MKKKYLLLVIAFMSLMGIYLCKNQKQFTSKILTYQGNNLRISIDGSGAATLPTSGNYYLTDYQCDNNNTKITWNRTTYELSISNGKDGGGVACDLTFESTPLLSSMAVGSYVAYTGSGGTVGSTNVSCKTNGSASSSTASYATESPNSCKGQNAREDLDTSGYTYGYCYSTGKKYYTTGWRIAYILDGKVRLVSAGSPQCNVKTSTYIKTANAQALKYCNSSYVDGNCTCSSSNNSLCDSASTDAWAINDTDFYYMTKAISGVGKRLTDGSSTLGDSGGTLGSTLSCYSKYSYQECGYNHDLIDNGGFYWFAAQDSSFDSLGVHWNPDYRIVFWNSDTTIAYGLRPIISLSSSVYVTGGSGTMEDPYTIAK